MTTSFEVLVTLGENRAWKERCQIPYEPSAALTCCSGPQSNDLEGMPQILPLVNVKHTSTMHIQDHQLGHGNRWRCGLQALDFTNVAIHERREDIDFECLMPRGHECWGDAHEGARTRASLKHPRVCLCGPGGHPKAEPCDFASPRLLNNTSMW